jgi:outer membrane protein OmpA-like peptidoglycan-associated protein
VYCELCGSQSQSNLDIKAKKAAKITKDTLPLPQNMGKPDSANLSPKDQLTIEAKHIVFFQYGSSEMIIETEHIEYFKLLKKYLDLNPTEKVLLTGHTDNTGTPEINLKYGQKRAESVKSMLINQYQINAKQLASDSKGLAEPMTDNTSEAGRNKNRRVEIILKK